MAKIVYYGSTPKRSDYIGNFVYEALKLLLILDSEGRISVKRNSADSIIGYEYQYFYKDHSSGASLCAVSGWLDLCRKMLSRIFIL